MEELLNQYFFERVLQKTDPKYLDELAGQILEECLLIFTKAKKEFTSPVPGEGDTAVLRCIQYIEANLFNPLHTEDLTHFSRTSTATLFRKFKSATQLTPFEYIRKRRLDESRQLLKTGNYNVGDVAMLVGYEDLAAFSKAFKKHFGAPPSRSTLTRQFVTPTFRARG